MRFLIPVIRSFISDEDGPTAVEYAVMLAAILLTVIATIGAIGSTSGGIWSENNQKLEDAGF